MADDYTARFNEMIAKSVEKLESNLTELQKDSSDRLARIEQILNHHTEKRDLILEVIQEYSAKSEAQEKRHFEQIKVISDQHESSRRDTYKKIGELKDQQYSIKLQLRWAAGALAVIFALVTFFRDPIIKLFTREEQQQYQRHNHEPE
jgi:hypothetical protein